MQLNDFVENYIPGDLRRARSFEGGRGWVFIYNQLIRRFEREGLIKQEEAYEVPLFTADLFLNDVIYRRNLIEVPTDFAKVIDIWEVDDINSHYLADFEQGKLKMREDYDAMTITYKTGTTPFQATGTPTTTVMTIDATYASDDDYQDYGFVMVSGTLRGQCRKVEYSRDDGGNTKLVWRKPFSVAPSATNQVLLLTKYLLMRYMASYPILANYDDQMNVGDRFNTALVSGMCWLGTPIESKNRRAFATEFEKDIDELKTELNTPSMEEARPAKIPYPNFDESREDTYTYVGE